MPNAYIPTYDYDTTSAIASGTLLFIQPEGFFEAKAINYYGSTIVSTGTSLFIQFEGYIERFPMYYYGNADKNNKAGIDIDRVTKYPYKP